MGCCRFSVSILVISVFQNNFFLWIAEFIILIFLLFFYWVWNLWLNYLFRILWLEVCLFFDEFRVYTFHWFIQRQTFISLLFLCCVSIFYCIDSHSFFYLPNLICSFSSFLLSLYQWRLISVLLNNRKQFRATNSPLSLALWLHSINFDKLFSFSFNSKWFLIFFVFFFHPWLIL